METVPIQNIYYMFCYAWSRFDIGEKAARGAEDSPDILELLTKVLLHEVRNAIRKGLDRDYVPHLEDLSGPKGRIEFSETLKRNLLHNMQVHCSFDDLSHNVKHNQIIKATLVNLSKTKDLDKAYREKTKLLSFKFSDVDDIRIHSSDFHQIQLNRNNAHYDFLMKVCALINSCLLPEERGMGFKFSRVANDNNAMGLVFEDFVRNFYKIEQDKYSVSRDKFRWDVSAADEEESLSLLPIMETDISMTSKDKKIVIETKFYKETLKSSGRSEKTIKKLNSSNLYQLFSYLKNMEQKEYPANEAEGILLYPTVDDDLDLSYQIQGHKLKVRTINLNQNWKDIHQNLLGIVGSKES